MIKKIVKRVQLKQKKTNNQTQTVPKTKDKVITKPLPSQSKNPIDTLSPYESKLIKLAKSYGFIIKEDILAKQKNKREYLIDALKDYIKNTYLDLHEEIGEIRKRGEDMFIEGLKLQQAEAKQKLAFATMNYKDIETYLIKIKTIKNSLPKLKPKEDD